MARAKCSKCGNIQYWHAYKGTKLIDLKSDCCYAPLQSLTSGQQNKYKGRHHETCVICGQKGMVGAWCGIVFPQVDFRAFPLGQDPSPYKSEVISKWEIKTFPKDSPIHSYHIIMPIDKTLGEMSFEEIQTWKEISLPPKPEPEMAKE